MVSKETGKLSHFDNLCIHIYCGSPFEHCLFYWLLQNPLLQYAISELLKKGAMNG